ncbi:MAG: hypothetical protein IKT40_08750 [Bacilli bacterium]|nr:hypothetical protein [Bacilli bacterium]
MQNKIINFVNNFIIEYKNSTYDRCIIEHFRNELSKHFNIPCGHRFKFEEWFEIQDYAFELLLINNKITKNEFEFYIKRFNF